jgi:hypothetical protein
MHPRRDLVWVLLCSVLPGWSQEPPEASPEAQRTQLNLARQTNTASGESQRNENIRVNPLDTATAS